MLTPVGLSKTRWEAQCSGCLETALTIDGSHADAEAAMRAAGWEFGAGGTTWCVACQRSAREVKQHDRRGRRRR